MRRELPLRVAINIVDGGKYRICKSINHKQKYFGTFPHIKEAFKRRDKLIFHNWNTEYAGITLNKKLGENRFIQKRGKHYQIYKTNPETKKREIYDSGIKTLKEAREIRNWWEQHNWDWDALEI